MECPLQGLLFNVALSPKEEICAAHGPAFCLLLLRSRSQAVDHVLAYVLLFLLHPSYQWLHGTFAFFHTPATLSVSSRLLRLR